MWLIAQWPNIFLLQSVLQTKAVFDSRKIFSGKYLFSGNAIFRKGKYFQVFDCIWENIVKNIFWCLVVLLKIPWKIHFLLLAHIFSDFLRCQTNIIISFLNPETQITPRKKKFIIRSRLGSTTGEIARSRLVLRSRLGSTTGEIAIEDNNLVRGRSVFRKGDAIGDDNLGRGRSNDAIEDNNLGRGRSVLGCDTVGDDDLSRALLGSSSLSLSARGRVSLSLSSFCVFRKMGIWR